MLLALLFWLLKSLLAAPDIIKLLLLSLVRNFMAHLADSVLPAPDSPLITMACFYFESIICLKAIAAIAKMCGAMFLRSS